MKHGEIKVGTAYYYDRSTNWQLYGGGSRAVVVAEGRWKVDRQTWQRTPPEPYKVDKGSGVLVDLYWGPEDKSPRREVVSAAHLRGLYDETVAAVDAMVLEWQERERAAMDAHDDARRDAKMAIQRARSLGIVAVMNGTNVEIAAVALERLLDAFEAQQ